VPESEMQPSGGGSGRGSVSSMPRPFHLVVVSLEPWDDVWRRNQYLVSALLELGVVNRVLFVEPTFDWLHRLRGHRGVPRRRELRPVPTDPRIIRFQPSKVAPRILGRFADQSTARQVVRAVIDARIVEPTIWVNDSTYAVSVSFALAPVLYDITDDWTEAGGPPRARDRVRINEDILLESSDAVVVCSESLARSRRKSFPELVVIPNAVDVDLFTTPAPRPDDLPSGPTAVYVGTLHEDRLDIDLVVDLATRAPQVHLVFVGPNSLSDSSTRRLAAMGNVHLLGLRPHDQVPGYLQHADVVIIPHVVSPFTDSLDPIKAYECLAVGRPTVATPVAGFRGLDAPIRVLDRAEFVTGVLDAVADPSPSRPTPVPSWRDRAEEFAVQLRRTRTASKREIRVSVVFVDHCAKLSGGELALVRVLPALIEMGVDAHVILGEHGPLEDKIRDTGATVEVMSLDTKVGATRRDEVRLGGVGPARVIAAWKDTWRLRRRLRELRPNVVHTNSLKAALYGGLAARLAGIPVVWHIRDRIASDYLPTPAVHLVRLLANILPQVVLANSRATKKTLGLRRRVDVVPSAVVYDPLVMSNSERLSSDREFTVAMIGRLAPWKGQDVFLRAFAEAFRDGPELALVVGSAMFGEDEYESELRGLVVELGIDKQVTFVGFTEDVLAVLDSVDCLVHASLIPEPFGQVVIEGMAACLPVIASNEGGPAEVITDGVDGLLCRPGDHQAMAAMLRELKAHPETRERLGKAAVIRTRQFAPERVARLIFRAYRSVAPR
jgi:glycosyltransferase involved in cell wall biosynthesis